MCRELFPESRMPSCKASNCVNLFSAKYSSCKFLLILNELAVNEEVLYIKIAQILLVFKLG